MTPPDLLETGTRLRRLLWSLAAAVVMGGITAAILWQVIDPQNAAKAGDWRVGPWRALFFFTALAAGAGFLLAHTVLKRRDDRKWREPPKATARPAE